MGRKKIADDKKQINVTGKVPPELKAKVQELVVVWDVTESGVLKRLLEIALKYLDCFTFDDEFLDHFSALPPDRQRDLLDHAEMLYRKYGRIVDDTDAEADFANARKAA